MNFLKFDKYIIDQSPPDLNYGLLKVVPASRYSSAMPWHIDQVADIIQNETKNENIHTITDACANIGVDTILFRLLFPYQDIVAIELNMNTFKVLQENMDNICTITSKYRKPIIVKNMDCLDYIYNNPSGDKSPSSTDLVYFDPPWPENYKQGTIDLYLSGQHLGSVIHQLLIKNPCLVIVKLPFNMNIPAFEYHIGNANIHYYTIYTLGRNPKIAYELAFIRL